jgi:hypothetical protein
VSLAISFGESASIGCVVRVITRAIAAWCLILWIPVDISTWYISGIARLLTLITVVFGRRSWYVVLRIVMNVFLWVGIDRFQKDLSKSSISKVFFCDDVAGEQTFNVCYGE